MNEKTPKDKDLDAILTSVSIPKHDDGLSQRIITAAAVIPQHERLWDGVLSIFREFKLPAPAYSLAAIAILGFVVGYDGTFINIDTSLYFDDIAATSALETFFAEDTLL